LFSEKKIIENTSRIALSFSRGREKNSFLFGNFLGIPLVCENVVFLTEKNC
jgi:hypothetical protein